MRHQPSASGSFDPSFFNNNDDFFEMSKFESFMDRKSRQANNRSHRSISGGRGHNSGGAEDAISPRSDDGMSFVSKKKHDNYANVVMEMKRKQYNAAQHQQQQLWGNDNSGSGWSDFGNSNDFNQPEQAGRQSRRQNVHQEMHLRPQQQQQQRYAFNEPPVKQPAERTGRKLYRDSAHIAKQNASNSSENQQRSIPMQRSRSRVRRTADLQRKLAQTYITAKTNRDDDEMSDTGSVVSSVFLGNSRTDGSGSWENSHGFKGSGERKKKGLDALLNNKCFTSSTSVHDWDNASAVSGAGSVAARRRAKAALKNSPHRPSNLDHVNEDAPAKVLPLQPPPSNSARRNMRMKMQNNTNKGQTSPFGRKHEFNAFTLDSNIEDEVNSALKELKLDHPEMDFTFDRMGSGDSRGGSVDSSNSGRLSVAQMVRDSPPKQQTFNRDPSKSNRHSPVTVGSQKTHTTKSMTAESSLDGSPDPTVQRINNNVNRPQNNVISVEQSSESIERCSESSSLTDASDWYHASGGGSGRTNMFKDINKGSNYHKSKRIVRVGESISENDAKSPSMNDADNIGTEMPSIKDRITQLKSSASPTNKIHNSPGGSIEEEPMMPREKSSVYSSSSSSTIQTSLRRRNELPPQVPTSSGQSPFQIKLRQTKNILHEVSDNTVQEIPDINSRNNGNSWKEKQQAKQYSIEPDQVVYNQQDEMSPSALPESTRKLTYREQQELLKKQQQEKIYPVKEEAKKDVAALIRERIALSKQNNTIPPSPKSNIGSELDIGSLRGNLKRTSYAKREPTTFVNSMDKTSPLQEGKKVDPPSDPTSAPMVATSKRAEKSDPSVAADPRAALMAAINKRASPPCDKEDDVTDPRANIAAMLQNRIALSGDTVSKSEAKNNLSAILANRTPPADVQENVDATSDQRPALKNDPKYEKYFKMLKVGMPLPVVQHAMTRDGLDPSIMECDHNRPAPEPKPEGLPLKDDPAYAKYFKMLKLGLPMGAVKNAMERDGLNSSVMDGNHNLPVSVLTSDSSVDKKRQKDTHRRTRLHWDTPVGKVKSNTVWALVNKDEELDNIVIDETEFTNLFQAEIKASSAPLQKSGSSFRNVVQVIDPKRANNGGIILARLRMSYDDMAKAVERIDETAMTANQAQGIVEYMPTLDERKKLRDYMKAGGGDSASKFDKLCECEKFMVAMMTVKQSKRKLRALLFKLQFRGCIHDLARDVFSIEKACDELSASIRLRKLLGIVLNIGNRLNTAGPGEKRKAGSFSIKSLLKLNQAKAFDNKTTFLHYVVLVVQRNSESLLDFKEDLPTALKADKIYWDQCVNELEEVETQLENVRKLALHEAKASKIIYSLPNKNKQQEDNDSDELSVESISLEEEVALLRSTKIGMFALSAIKKVSQLRERVDISREKFCQLLEYFGEDGESSSMQPHELFEIITTFCRNFDVAREDVIKMEKAKKRDEKKKDDKSQRGDSHPQSTKQTINPHQPTNPPRALIPKQNPHSTSNAMEDFTQLTTPMTIQNGRHSVARQLPPQYSDPALNGKVDNSELVTDYSAQNPNTEAFITRYPDDESPAPEEISPLQSQSDPAIEQKSSKNEAAQNQASTPPQCISPNSVSPRTMSRRDRRERVRSRSLAQSTRSNPQPSAAVTTIPPKEPLVSKSQPVANIPSDTPSARKSELPSPKSCQSSLPSNKSARAAARDRYARHKKMMHQRRVAS